MYKVMLRDIEFEVEINGVHTIQQESELIRLYDANDEVICIINQNELICLKKVL